LQRLKSINLKLPAKASLWYLFVNAAAKGVGFIITPFFTRMVSGQAYGELTLYLSLLGIASVSCSAINTGSAIYKGMRLHENEKESFIKSSLIVSLSFSALFCLLLFAFRSFFQLKSHLYLPLTLQIICDAIVAVYLSSAKYLYRYKEVCLITALSSVVPPLITLSLLKVANGRFRVRIYVLLIISICLAIYSLFKLLRKKGEASGTMAKELFKSAIPLFPHSLSAALSGQVDKLVITSHLGAIALAKYAVIHSLGVSLQFAISSVGFALGPWIVRRLEKEEYKEVSTLTGILLSVFSALSLCLIALAPEAMKILAPKEYLDAFPAFLPIALSTPMALLSSVITVCLVHFGLRKETAIVSVTSASVSLLLNFTLIEKLGYLGAGLALLLSQIISTLLGLYFLFIARRGITLSIGKIIKTIIPTSALGIILFLLFEIPALRVVFLIAPAVMLLNDFYNLKGLIIE